MALRLSDHLIEKQIDSYFATTLYQGRHGDSGQPELIKTLSASFPDIRDIRRLEREHWMLQELGGNTGILPVGKLEYFDNGTPALISRATGLPLSQYLEDGSAAGWDVGQILDLSMQLATALDAVHDRRMVHKNVAPKNILLDLATWSAKLMNFDIATVLSVEHQDKALSKRMEGSLPYISPEQTGRTAQLLDYRSDFYSLGVVMFQLLFGRLPFDAQSNSEWVHAHIGKVPQLPKYARARIPPVLVDLVLRLLSKNPEDRYQSSYGLLHDLRECQRQISLTGHIRPFPLGEHDVSEIFRIPRVLFGRDAELETLKRVLSSVSEGENEFCLISGSSGVGKSALVNEMREPFLRTGGFYLSCKFDQFERAKPYAGISTAFAGLVRELLILPEEDLARWKARLLDALAGNAQVLIEIVPEFEQILGAQPALPALPSTEAQNRVHLTFLNFVRALVAEGRPLILYLDDLQWGDAPTLNLLQRLVTTRDIGPLFVLAAYRSNETEANHLLTLTIQEVEKARRIHHIALPPLSEAVVVKMVAAALRCAESDCEDLAHRLFQRTDGNPFFVHELLKFLVADGVISFDRRGGRWIWDQTAINQVKIGDSVVEFLIGNLRRLPQDTSDILSRAACIGHEFDLDTLSELHDRPKQDLGRALMTALKRNIIIPLDDGYQLFDSATAHTETALDAAVNARFRFQHDRLHQAAYELIGAEDRKAVHWSIGRLLQAAAPSREGDGHVMNVVRHLNEAVSLIRAPEDRQALAGLNLQAAANAQNASSHQSALHYLRMCRSLLGEDPWQDHYKMAKRHSALFAQTAYLTGSHTEADAELSVALDKVHTPLEKAEVLSMRTRHYSTLGRMEDSILAALQGLKLLGIDIDRTISDRQVAKEEAAITANRGDRPIADLSDAERMTDPRMSVAVGLLMEIFPAAFLSGAGNLFRFSVLKSVNLSLQFGNSTETAFAYAAYGMLLSGGLKRPAEGYEYGKLALEMNERFEDIGLKSRIIYVYSMFIHHWSNPWESMTDWFKRGIEAGYRSGDLLYLAYNAQDCIIWDPSLDVETVIREHRKYMEIVADCDYADSLDSGSLFLQMMLNFAGQTDGLYSLTSEAFDEQACFDGMLSRKFMTGVANYYIYKSELHCLYSDFDGALPLIEAQEKLSDSVMSLPQATRFRFLAYLTYAARYPQMDASAQDDLRCRMAVHLEQMSVWAANCAENFAHLEAAMRAEGARLDGDDLAAFRFYDQALALAAENGFLRDQAMIHERAAAAMRAAGVAAAAEFHTLAARMLYARWGATRKVALMDAQEGAAGGIAAHALRSDHSGAPDSDTPEAVTHDSLDLASLMQAARAISGEVQLARLLARTMDILLESTGAQRGVLLSRENDQWHVEVACDAEQKDRPDTPVRTGATPDKVPFSIINYVWRTHEPLVLDNVADNTQFSADPYVAARGTRSIICVPISRGETFGGVIYLENDLAEYAFPQARVSIVELLAAQASISIENANLYDGLEQNVAARTAELNEKTVALEAVANQLSKYLSPQVYQRIFSSKQEVRLTSERKRLTVFFSDLVGFTEITERMESEDLTGLLNHYLSEMSEVALAHGATIDKFVGDAIVIFFGDPETRGVKEDALACARMAIAMRERLRMLGQEWMNQGVDRLVECRMGIHTGYCTVGNFGSENRMDYTIVGGTVNMASRLETAAHPGAILISHETFSQIKEEVLCTEHGQIRAQGFEHPIATYEIVDLIENVPDAARPIRETGPHMHLNIDSALMDAAEREAAAATLRAAAARLDGGSSPVASAGGTDAAPEEGPEEDRGAAPNPETRPAAPAKRAKS